MPAILLKRRINQLAKVRRTKARHSVPSHSRRETRRVTTIAASTRDIRKRLVGTAIQPWVQETQDWLALGEECIVHQADDSGERGAGGRGATDGADGVVPDESVVVALCGDVGVGAAALVVEAVVEAIEVLDVGVDGGGLVFGLAEVVAETGAGGKPTDCDFRLEGFGAADRGDPWAGLHGVRDCFNSRYGRNAYSGEVWKELVSVLAVVGVASTVRPYTSITAAEEEGDTAGPELCKARASTLGV